jgi:ATP adenylyltransferase
MDRLWTPWRYDYITKAEPARRQGVPAALDGWPEAAGRGCIFCNMIGAVEWAIQSGMPIEEVERAAHIVERGERCFVCLNAYPYSTGHVLIVPYVHLPSLAELERPTAIEMILTAQRAEVWLRGAYHPDGLNMGLNLGEAAGAGVTGHLHLHALPRWRGDTNFMTVIATTRILPETLDVTWEKLRIQVT